jgi:hypothetical protein
MWVFIIYVNKQVKVLRNSNLQRWVAALTKTGKEENDNYCFRVSTNECSTYKVYYHIWIFAYHHYSSLIGLFWRSYYHFWFRKFYQKDHADKIYYRTNGKYRVFFSKDSKRPQKDHKCYGPTAYLFHVFYLFLWQRCYSVTMLLYFPSTYHKQSISVMPKMVSNRLLLNHLNPFHITLIFLLLYILSGIIPDVRQSAQEKNIDHMYLCRS